MTGPEYDAELEAFLKRRSPMHRRLSDIDHAEPSAELDRLVLNSARQAIETPREPSMFRTSRWALPVGLAATILIAFTVILNIDRHGPGAARSVASNASPVAKAQAPATAREEAEPQAHPAASAADSSRLLATRNAVVANVPPPQAPAPPAPPAGATAEPSALPYSAATASAEARSSALPANATGPHASPDVWLREINRLRAAGRTADADRELAAFRAAYPSHPAYSVAKPPAR